MPKAVITLTDSETPGEVSLVLEFDPPIAPGTKPADLSTAQMQALQLLQFAQEGSDEFEEEDDDGA